GADLPEDPEFRAWFADAIEGKHDPERGKGRPRKLERWDMIRAAVELGIAECYRKWHAAFEDDPELAWLRAQALRLRQKQPDAEAWRRIYDLNTEAGRESYAKALTALGACPCPLSTVQGHEAPHELAKKAAADEYGERWRSMADTPLTPNVVARIVTR